MTPVPAMLYHYTTLGSLEGILDSKCLWATDWRFLSDTTEFSYPRDVLSRVVDRLSPEVRSPHGRWLLDIARAISIADGGLPLYVASLCADSNVPGMWEDYADNQRGATIGLDQLVLFWAVQAQQYSLGPVLYEVAEQERHLDSCLRDAISAVPAVEATTPSTVTLALHFSLAIVVALSLVKNTMFEREAEWRISRQQLVGGTPAGLQHRGSANVPFELVNLTDPTTGTTALTEVVLGDKAPVGTERDVRSWLARGGTPGVLVRRSH